MKIISLCGMPASVGNVRCILLIGSMLCVLLCVQVSEGQQKFCGKTLTDAMDLLCVNGFNDKISSAAPMKRTANDFQMEYNENEPEDIPLSTSRLIYPGNSFDGLNPFWVNVFANVLAKTRRRREGGVYDECCRKPCKYSELAAYCRPL